MEITREGEIEMNIKEKYTPETHQTRCGKPWRWLDVKGHEKIIAVDDGSQEDIGVIENNGVFIGYNSHYISGYGLVPIQHPPMALPTNLRPEIKWAAMDEEDDTWYFYTIKPTRSCDEEMWVTTEDSCDEFMDTLFNLPEDLVGWENSLHELVDGEWRRVQS